MVERVGSNGSMELAGVQLTPAESGVFLMRAHGLGCRAIADELGISNGIVSDHLNNISLKVRRGFPDSTVCQIMTRMALRAVVGGLVTYDGVPSDPRFSVKEIEIAQLILRGRANSEIAKLLIITKKTMESHLSHIDRKLGFKKRENRSSYLARAGRIAYVGMRQIPDGYGSII